MQRHRRLHRLRRRRTLVARRRGALTAIDLARACGIHRNTVLKYEQWGLLPPVARLPNGYRAYAQYHLEQLRFARIALPGPYPGGSAPVYAMVRAAARGDLREARARLDEYAANVRRETRRAHAALRELERWAAHPPRPGKERFVHRRAAAARIGCTLEALRTWERNGLARITRDARGYCLYDGATISRLKIIRALRTAGYGIAAILRMLSVHDAGSRELRAALDTPEPGCAYVCATDQWLTTLARHRVRVRGLRRQLARMAKLRNRA